MPYNTRRKSLSLTELGVHVPKRARAPSQTSPTTPPSDSDEPPSKKPRASDSVATPAPGAMSPPSTTNIRIKTEVPRHTPRGAEHTPPPSPGAEGVTRLDTEGIKDEIVVGVIRQLEKTGNRPHTSKELAAVLANCVPTIDSSTNPNALIQARLATYLKGPWPIVSPCPLGKQQESIHPRRVFYYLTTQPHQSIPEVSQLVPIQRRIISPSLSSQADEDSETRYNRARNQLSPSPEVVLSSPELEDDSDIDSASTFSGRNSISRDVSTTNLSHNRRAQSPPLEREERDFKQTANELQEQRRNSHQKTEPAVAAVAAKPEEHDDNTNVRMSIETTEDAEESAARRNREAVATLFADHLTASGRPAYDLSSPVLRPHNAPVQPDGKSAATSMVSDSRILHKNIDAMTLDNHDNDDPMDIWSAWDESGQLRSPEDVELDELQGVFDGFC